MRQVHAICKNVLTLSHLHYLHDALSSLHTPPPRSLIAQFIAMKYAGAKLIKAPYFPSFVVVVVVALLTACCLWACGHQKHLPPASKLISQQFTTCLQRRSTINTLAAYRFFLLGMH